MKLTIDEALEIEFEPWAIEQAKNNLDEVRRKYTKTGSGELARGNLVDLLLS